MQKITGNSLRELPFILNKTRNGKKGRKKQFVEANFEFGDSDMRRRCEIGIRALKNWEIILTINLNSFKHSS